MSPSFLAAAVSTVAAAAFTGMLVRRCTRVPRLDLIAWSVAAAGLAIALAAQALGYHQGFGSTTFRAVQIGGRLIAPLALCWGLAEVVGRTFLARFGSRLALLALFVIGSVILVLDPLASVTFSTAWPAAATYYEPIPTAVLLLIAVATAGWAVVALAVAGVRARGEPGWRDLFPAVGAGAAAALLTEGLGVKLPVNSGYAALCVLAVLLAWLAGRRSSGLQLAALHETEDGADTGWNDRYTDDTGYGRYRAGTGGYGRVSSNTGYGRVSSDTDFGGLYRPDTGGFGRVGSDTGFGDHYRPDTGGFGEVGSDTGYGFYRTDTDFGQMGSHRLGEESEPLPAVVETGDMLPVNFDVFTPASRDGSGGEEEETARLYGQIAIYTLIDGQAEEFDGLAQAVVEKVKALEPDTLAYIVHGVPSAPLQRILYEVYRDEAAFEEHGQQPYIQDFEEDRKPYVLATNVIELGVRQAKLTPLDGASAPPGPAGTLPGQPSRSRESGQPPRPGDPGQPSRSRESGQPPRPGDPGQPSRSRESGQPPRPGDPGQPPWPRESGHPSWPGESGQPSRPRGNGAR